MKTEPVFLSDGTHDAATVDADAVGITLGHRLTLIIEDYYSGGSAAPGAPEAFAEPLTSRLGKGEPLDNFDVDKWFGDYPPHSRSLARQFVAGLRELPNITAFRKGRGISFRPQFVQIDYLVSHRGTPALVASVYGGPNQFDDPRGLLSPDRRSYSRARLLTDDDVYDFLQFAKQAYGHRYGKPGADA